MPGRQSKLEIPVNPAMAIRFTTAEEDVF